MPRYSCYRIVEVPIFRSGVSPRGSVWTRAHLLLSLSRLPRRFDYTAANCSRNRLSQTHNYLLYVYYIIIYIILYTYIVYMILYTVIATVYTSNRSGPPQVLDVITHVLSYVQSKPCFSIHSLQVTKCMMFLFFYLI